MISNQHDKVYEVKEVCYCKDVSGFTEYVKEERDIEGDIDIKIGIDGGGGSFKVTKNAIEKKQQNANADDLKSPPKKRTAKHQKKRYKDSGVKKLFIICIVEGILETYDNVKTILNLEHVTLWDTGGNNLPRVPMEYQNCIPYGKGAYFWLKI